MSPFEINHHTFTERECPHCHTPYLVGGGGQKSGSSPAVHIEPGVQGKAVGYCSSRCLTESQGASIENTMAYKVLKNWGLDYDKIFPKGYLAPARVPHQERAIVFSRAGELENVAL